jgi:SAM-dependent methyltransferase
MRDPDSTPVSRARALASAAASPPSAGAGRLRRAARRVLLRLARPVTAGQQGANEAVAAALADVDGRLRAIEDVQVAALGDDLVAALESLRARVAAAEEITSGARALPYAAGGALEHFREPGAGLVIGYRNGGGSAGQDTYRGFEDVFRGPEERVAERQAAYLELLAQHAPVLDVGCGRGELLDLLRERGVECSGVDSDAGMVARSREKGHEVELATADAHLERLPEGRLGAVFSAQVLEHLPYADLRRFLALARSRLRPGGIMVAETVNPHAPHALKNFWIDPTHQHPLFPEVLLVLCRLSGFASAYAYHPLGSGHVDDDRMHESEYAVVARA